MTKLNKIFKCLECPNESKTFEDARAHAKEEKHWAWGVIYLKEKKA